MALDLPRTLTPSKVLAFTNCPLAFRFSQIEHRPEPPSPHAVKGTLVHAALEGLFWHHAPGERTPVAAQAELGRCWDELQHDEEYGELALSPEAAVAFGAQVFRLAKAVMRRALLRDLDHWELEARLDPTGMENCLHMQTELGAVPAGSSIGGMVEQL